MKIRRWAFSKISSPVVFFVKGRCTECVVYRWLECPGVYTIPGQTGDECVLVCLSVRLSNVERVSVTSSLIISAPHLLFFLFLVKVDILLQS